MKKLLLLLSFISCIGFASAQATTTKTSTPAKKTVVKKKTTTTTSTTVKLKKDGTPDKRFKQNK